MPNLDDMLEPQAAAKWLGLSRRKLAAKSRGKNAPVPALRLSRKCVRYNPRMILAKMAKDSGLAESLIAASLNIKSA